MDFPVNPMEILKQGKSFVEEKSRKVSVGLFIDPSASDELIESVRTTLIPQTPTARVFTEVIGSKTTLRNQRIAELTFCVFVLGTEPSSERQEEILERVRVVTDSDSPVAIVAMGGSKTDLAKHYGVSILNIVLIGQVHELAEELAQWAAEEVKDERLALAANFVFMRRAIATEYIKATSMQNAIVGGVLFVPGADMPVMTLNQIKMLFQIAAAFDQPINKDRIKEVGAVVGSAFVFRTLARQAAGLVPVIGWGIKAAVGYGATYAMGVAALNYFDEGNSIDTLANHLKASSSEIIERGKEYASVARERLPKKAPRDAALEDHHTEKPRKPQAIASALKSRLPKKQTLRSRKEVSHRYIESGRHDQ